VNQNARKVHRLPPPLRPASADRRSGADPASVTKA
jgi:hypothetical protein